MDGSGLKQVGTRASQPFLTPDGSMVGFLASPDPAGGCFSEVRLVSLEGDTRASVSGRFAQGAAQANSPVSPDGRHILLTPCDLPRRPTLFTIEGQRERDYTVPASLNIGEAAVFNPLGWTADGKPVFAYNNDQKRRFVGDINGNEIVPAGADATILVQTQFPWEQPLGRP